MRAPGIRSILALVAATGGLLLAFDILGDGDPAKHPDHIQRIDAYVREEMDDSRIPGLAIAVVEGGKVIHARGFGHDGGGNAITSETPFWIGSNTKSFTALAVRQLAERGLIDIDAPAQRYLPDFQVKGAGDAARITVRHLLNQTSGFSRADGVALVFESKERSLVEAVADIRDVELNRPVGESYEYSNLNYVVLGLLVERISGESWTEYVQRHIFTPLGMTNSYTSLAEADTGGLTKLHRYIFGWPVDAEGDYTEALAPTGYLFSTASDMARYLIMYLEGGELEVSRVLSEAGIESMLTPATNLASFQLQSQAFEARYGEGWFVGKFGVARDARWHQGSLPYFTAWMVMLPDTNQAVIVLINAGNQFEIAGANAAFSRIPQGVVNILRGELPPTGIGVTRFFIIFDTVVALVVVLQVWSLARVAKGHLLPAGRFTWLPLTWEVGAAAAILAAYPSATGASWPMTFAFVPDLVLVLVTVAGLWLLTGTARVARLLGVWRGERTVAPASHTATASRQGTEG